MSNNGTERDRPLCYECDDDAVGIFEGTVPPSGTVRRPACRDHAPNSEPVERFDTDRFANVDDVVPNGGRGSDGSHRTLGRWTFEYAPAREFVEDRLHGQVLNACAGKTKLDHDGVIVRNDLNPERDADLHVDVTEIADHFVTGKFDVIVFDPPFDDHQAEDKYDGLRADSVLEAYREFQKLVAPHGHVITFGWNSWGMSSIDAFEREETVLLQRGPCLRDVIVTVDRRTNHSIAVKRGGESA